jgi:ribosomal protein S18 acetylase RimI-like enzyme
MNEESGKQFKVTMSITIRACVSEDLPNMEWFGLFTPHREIILSAYERHLRKENLMLVADANGFPIGQVWVDLEKKKADSAGLIWALRVIPWLQSLGIGTRLIQAGEQALRRRGYHYAMIGVEIQNEDARRLYERLGYQILTREQEDYSYMTPEGVPVSFPVEQWLLRKEIPTTRHPVE